ncbi:hypothetical protein [Streptomyces sp. NPDC014894]|uniref:hypothetical protein n=1 Tax=Streptomyces sp. NPDC014894 TaxID=3364931 RepID=UPI0036F5E82E
MQGDATPLTDAGGDRDRSGRGPRHAAPRRSLLSRLQKPAGKAIALAAMPTAVLMGMSLTPRPALAEGKDIPYAPGPCVTRSDEPAASESPKPSKSPSPSASSTPLPTVSATPSPTASGTATATETAAAAPDGGAGKPAPATSPSASRSADAGDPAPGPPPDQDGKKDGSRDPLDPLGLGEAIEDLLDGPGEKQEPAPSRSGGAAPDKPDAGRPKETDPTAESATKPADKPQRKPTGEPAADPTPSGSASAGPSRSTDRADPSGEDADPAAERTRKAIEDAAAKAGAKVEELDEDAKGLDPKKDEAVPEGAKPHFPCPTPDPEALAAAKLEPGLPLLPDDPWVLETSLLTLTGLKYHGIVEVRTGGGKVKKALKFTASGVDIKDLHQLVKGPQDDTTLHAQARRGSTSTIRDGTVTMYTEELKGNLFGLIPITFSPRTPPPVDVPFAFFTQAKVTQAGQFGGTLTVPGLSNYLTGGDQ